MTTIIAASPEETIAAGRALAGRLSPGSAVALTGRLGAGKTCFVRGLVEGWGGADAVTSPTFTLVHEYPTPRGPIFHFDLYRAGSAEEVWSAAQDELGAADGMLVVEWADRFPELLPAGAVRVGIDDEGEGRRVITIGS